jgi:protein-tyrosine phosphatase
MFDLRACHVERTADQDYLIHWRGSRPGQRIAVYMSDDPEHYYTGEDPGTPVMHTTDADVHISNPDPGVRHYFYLESEQGEGVILAERKLSLQGTPNFRDLGGYETRDGRRLKWGKLYRSSKLSNLTDVDVYYVKQLVLTLVCDFRQVLEQHLEPSRLGEGGPHNLVSLPVAPGSLNSFLESLHGGVIDVQDAAGLMRDMNRELASGQVPQYAEMFRLLLAGDQQVLIHCASGKDRTGFGAALILDVLGVPEEHIIEDYLLTNKYLPLDAEIARLSQEFADHSGKAVHEDILRPLMEVRPEYIAACFEVIRENYASREHFFETALNLDEEKLAILRDRYLH